MSANRRAASTSDRCCARTTSAATLFHTAKKPVVVPTPDQSCAMVVCSALRKALSDFPRPLIALRSVAYRALVSDGGGGGRNCVGESTAIGAACNTCVNTAVAFAGGVGCQRPGRSGSEYGGNCDTTQPSFCRHARISA